MGTLYNIENSRNEYVGNVSTIYLQRELKLKVINGEFELILDNIIDVLEYVTNNKLHLVDMNGFTYSIKSHETILAGINKIGKAFIR